MEYIGGCSASGVYGKTGTIISGLSPYSGFGGREKSTEAVLPVLSMDEAEDFMDRRVALIEEVMESSELPEDSAGVCSPSDNSPGEVTKPRAKNCFFSRIRPDDESSDKVCTCWGRSSAVGSLKRAVKVKVDPCPGRLVANIVP